MGFALLTITLLCCAAADPARAQQSTAAAPPAPPGAFSERAPYRLVYDHLADRWSLQAPGGRQVETGLTAAGASIVAPVPPDRPLEVTVVNANPLLYDYQLLPPAAVGERRVRACRSVGRQFVAGGFLVGTRAIRGPDAPIPSLGSLWEQGGRVLTPPAELPTTPRGDVDRGEALSAARQAYQGYLSLLGHVEALATTLDDSVATIAQLAEGEPLVPLIDRLKASLDAIRPGLSDPARVPHVVLSEYGGVREAIGVLRAAAPGDSPAAAGVLEEAGRMEQGASEALARIRAPVRRMQQHLLILARARAGATQHFLLEPSETPRQVTVRVTPDTDFRAAVDSVSGFRAGDRAAYTSPRVAFLCQVSFGLAWMRPPAKYVVGAGGRVANESDAEDIRTGVAFLLHLTPEISPVGVLGGVGLGLGTGGPDLYLGGSLRFLEPLMVNAGLVWQREPRLPSGIQVGDTLADPARLSDPERRYRSTFFIGIGVAR